MTKCKCIIKRNYLCGANRIVIYLKPLRDAENELTPGYRSRLAQILLSHKDFQKEKDSDGKFKKHELETYINEANIKIKDWIDKKEFISFINKRITDFLQENDKRRGSLKVAPSELHRILRSLSLELEENTSGLGTLNKLFMAAELLHLETDPYNGLKLCLIEELEAHLYPQAQLRVIKALEEIKDTQIILTTHSTTLGSSIDLDKLIICKDNDVYPMCAGKTELAKGDYTFLTRFLDSTKANLFFARGVIIVEGDAENILIPTIAKIIGKPLHKFGVSIVNVGSTAFLRYAKIFMREDKKELNLPVAVVADLDVKAYEYYDDKDVNSTIPEVYVIEIDKINVGDHEYDISSLKGNIYTSLSDIKLDVKRTLNVENMPEGVNGEIEHIGTKPISSEILDEIRSSKKEKLEYKYNIKTVKFFSNKKWTLEYDLALSENLREYLTQAILCAKKIKSNENFFSSLYKENEGISSIEIPEEIQNKAKELCETGTQKEIAYNIFKPFISSIKPSKAVTSQIFAELLEQEFNHLLKNNNKAKKVIQRWWHYKLSRDKYANYIINAIDYVCN
ncbi:ATP-dependent endonuclease [bacterium]|nr:MAG: ATP-dependent endonuclease [bacterium]